jgi:hypothetical protein
LIIITIIIIIIIITIIIIIIIISLYQDLPEFICNDAIPRDENSENYTGIHNLTSDQHHHQHQQQQQQQSVNIFDSLIIYPPLWIPSPIPSSLPLPDSTVDDPDIGICDAPRHAQKHFCSMCSRKQTRAAFDGCL